MIIKVPIYVEIEKYSGTELSREVFFLTRSFTFYLQGRRSNIFIATEEKSFKEMFGDFKIITHEKALETLRTKK